MLKRLIKLFSNEERVEDISSVTAAKGKIDCCKEPQLNPMRDFGHARSFDFMHATCKKCGALWMNVFCTANGISGYERVSNDDACRLLGSKPGPERKALLTSWADKNL